MTLNPNSEKTAYSHIVKAGALGQLEDLHEAKQLILSKEGLPTTATVELLDVDVAQIRRSLAEHRERRIEKAVRRAHGKPRNEALAGILKDFALSPAQSKLNSDFYWRRLIAQIDHLTAKDAPLTLALPVGGGKVASSLKTGMQVLPDLAEWQAWSSLGAISSAIERVYKAGATVIAVPDAALHTADLGFGIEDVVHHGRQAQQDLKDLGLHSSVIVPDILKHLPSEWSPLLDSLLPNLEITEHDWDLIRSLVWSLNMKVHGMSIEREVLIASALAGDLHALPGCIRAEAHTLFQRAEFIVRHYNAVNIAIRRGGLIEKAVADLTGSNAYLRMSVHAKAIDIPEIRPHLFPTNRLVQHPALLPMHGIGVMSRGPMSYEFGITFYLASIIRGYQRMVWNGRVIGFEAPFDQEAEPVALVAA